ncbi:MAG: carbamoyltransferase HypF [Chloroflexi bacterium]|nr:carbamoyltransferase HypF [Chloroflexota bacterium]
MTARERQRIAIGGVVQGVGFRPFVYRLATELGLAGWVSNGAQGVTIEVEGAPDALTVFLLRLEAERPPLAAIHSLEMTTLDPAGYAGFAIRASDAGGPKTALVLPDIATCADCLAEVLDPRDRRHGYPFANCTNCGPRYTIIEALPYDRLNTTMRGFPLCPDCRAEYEDPADRRFHAQPIACPRCGPWLELWASDGRVLAARDEVLARAAVAIRAGQIVAVKGLGGFHLLVDAGDAAAVQRLRRVKMREEKPFALMAASLAEVERDVLLDPLEARLLRAPEAPIVLLRRRPGATRIAPGVAPGMTTLGIMLPATPLHHLLLARVGRPVVATSGNRADEPIQTDERAALTALTGLADLFLVHNRPIARHVDDSVARVVLDREMLLRRARGYAPLPVTVATALPPALAVGAHQKNTVAVALGRRVFLSQHLGDLEMAAAVAAFRTTIASLTNLFEARPAIVACDLHPDYASTRYAEATGLPVVRVQHHLAHVLACLAENEVAGPVLGVAWDGAGVGVDGAIWGGEFLRVDNAGWARVAHLRAFRLPGGEVAVREPRRAALGLLHALAGAVALDWTDLPPLATFTPRERTVLATMLARGASAPLTTSAGRLFDAVAALVGLRQRARFEGQAAMLLEQAAVESGAAPAYPVALAVDGPGPLVVDWGPLVLAVVADVRAGMPASRIAARFHATLAEAIGLVAERVGLARVALTGGCFQNALLLELAVARLRRAGFRPYWHQRVPPNDGGIALGQAVAIGRAWSPDGTSTATEPAPAVGGAPQAQGG